MALLLSKHRITKLHTLCPVSALFDGFVVSFVPGERSPYGVLRTIFLLALTVWAGTGAEVLFEYGISSFGKPATQTLSLRSTTSGSSSITYTEGRDNRMAQVGLIERSCPDLNTLSTFTDVFVDPRMQNITHCSPIAFTRSLCASGRTLSGDKCVPHMFPDAAHPTPSLKNWTTETWLSLIFASGQWTFESDGSDKDNGYVTFEPVQAVYNRANSQQLFTIDTIKETVNVQGLQRVHCSSGSSLLPGLKPGDAPFQVCLWDFDEHVLITHADYLNGEEKEGRLFGNGVKTGTIGAREILENVTKLQVSAIARWISVRKAVQPVQRTEGAKIVQRKELSARDVMLTLGIARPLLKFSSDDPSSFSTDTFEVGLWASASMSLRLIERAVVRGISILNDGDVVEAEVVSDTQQIATIEWPFLIQYITTVLILGLFTGLFRFLARKAPPVRLGIKDLLGYWVLDRDGMTLSNRCPKANVLEMNRTDSGDHLCALHTK